MKIKTKVKAGGHCPVDFCGVNHNQTVGLKVKTNVKSGWIGHQHNRTMARGLKVKTNVKAATMTHNHNETLVKGLKVKTGIKAGSTNGDIYIGH